MSCSPIVDGTNLVSFAILSAGQEIPDTFEVVSIRVEQHLNRIAEAEIKIRDGNTAKQTFEVTDSEIFKPGVEVEIKLGYDNKTDSVFKGIVTKQIIKVEEGGGSQLQVICKDALLKLAINRKNSIFPKIKDSAVIEQIAGSYNMATDVATTNVTHEEVVQYYSTDWDFILNRAEINGLVVLTNDGKLTVAKPAVADNPILQVQFGLDVIEFDGEIDATNQYASVNGNAWDMSTQDLTTTTANEPDVNNQGNISGSELANVLNAGVNNLQSAGTIIEGAVQSWADAALLKSRLSRFKGSITFQGSEKAKVNTTIKLMGLSSRFNGNALISGLTHIMHDGEWRTEAKIGLTAEWFTEKHQISAPTAAGLVPGIKGLQTGIVKAIDKDPDNQFRVQVTIPILGAGTKTVWARMSTFYTGNGFGAYFMPEINDEVILGFMNEDPRFPIIIGSVYSSSIPAPETPDADNTIKTLITQSKLQLQFDDKNKIITILTPGGNTMVYSDKDQGITVTDQNSNKIQMNNSGITIESQSNLTLKAAQEVNIQGASIKITGDQSVNATGGTMSLTGNETTSIDGSSECTISSNGSVSVKGLTVAIN